MISLDPIHFDDFSLYDAAKFDVARKPGSGGTVPLDAGRHLTWAAGSPGLTIIIII